MDQESSDTLPSLFPYFGYRNAAAAFDWLADAFGFETTVEPSSTCSTLPLALQCGLLISRIGTPFRMQGLEF